MIPFLFPPADRAARRRTVVLLWSGFAAYLAVSVVGDDGNLAGAATALAMLVSYTMLFRILHSVRMGQRNAPALDERERLMLYQAHFRAYQIQGAAMLLAVVYAMVAARTGALWLPATAREGVLAFAAVVIGLGLLPLSVLAWTAPEPPRDEEDAPAPEIRPSLTPAKRIGLGAIGVAALAAAWSASAGLIPGAEPHAGLLTGIGAGILVGMVILFAIEGRRA